MFSSMEKLYSPQALPKFFSAILGTREFSLIRIMPVLLAHFPHMLVSKPQYPVHFSPGVSSLLLLCTTLLHGHCSSPLCPTTPPGSSLASIYSGFLSNTNTPHESKTLVLTLPAATRPLALAATSAAPLGAIPNNCTQGLKVAWGFEEKRFPSPGQYFLLEFPKT